MIRHVLFSVAITFVLVGRWCVLVKIGFTAGDDAFEGISQACGVVAAIVISTKLFFHNINVGPFLRFKHIPIHIEGSTGSPI